MLEVLTAEAVSTSEIEGVHLNPASISSSLARHLGIPGHEEPGIGRDEAAISSVLLDAMEQCDAPVTIERLADWQRGIFGERPLGRVTLGALRTEEVIVASGRRDRMTIHFEAVPAARVQEEMETFVKWFGASRDTQDGMIRAGLAHLWLVTIHPFDDGNGRVTRALTDLAIEQDGSAGRGMLRMSLRILSVRKDYYQALQTSQNLDDLDATPWLQWFLEQAEEAALDSERIIRRVLAKTVFWAMHRGNDLNDRQRKVLSCLLDAGPEGFEGGMSTRKYEAMTGCSTPTASRDLGELARLDCLRMTGAGRGTRYEIPWEQILREG
jgi:Fic family protein